jgi:uncharacterized protein YjeT (DUF2065 family)
VSGVAARALSGARVAWGLLLVTSPRTAARRLTDRNPSELATAILRLLGARHVVQGVVTLVHPTATVVRAGAATDMLHAGTAAAWASWWPDARRPSALDAGIAAAFGVAGVFASSGEGAGAPPA